MGRKHLTEETGWVPAQYLKDEETYTMYVQRKLVEKIEKLPVFEKPKDNENACAPKITEKVKSQKAPDGAQVEFVCKVEGYPRPQITWFRQTAIIKPSPDFQIYYDDNNLATLVIKEVFPLPPWRLFLLAHTPSPSSGALLSQMEVPLWRVTKWLSEMPRGKCGWKLEESQLRSRN